MIKLSPERVANIALLTAALAAATVLPASADSSGPSKPQGTQNSRENEIFDFRGAQTELIFDNGRTDPNKGSFILRLREDFWDVRLGRQRGFIIGNNIRAEDKTDDLDLMTIDARTTRLTDSIDIAVSICSTEAPICDDSVVHAVVDEPSPDAGHTLVLTWDRPAEKYRLTSFSWNDTSIGLLQPGQNPNLGTDAAFTLSRAGEATFYPSAVDSN